MIRKNVDLRSLWILTVTLWATSFPDAAAQSSADESATLSLTIHAGADVSRTDLDVYWSTRPAAGFEAATPFGRGELAATGLLLRHHARTAEQPDYTALVTALMWGPALRLPHGVRWTNSLGAGIYTMLFSGAENAGSGIERELCVIGSSTLRMPTGRGWSAEAGVTGFTVFTHEPLREALLLVGLRKDLRRPSWLTAILR